MMILSSQASVPASSQLHVDLLNVLAHECRTPLTSIRGFAETLQRFEGRITSEQRLEMLEMIQQQADRLIRLTHNLTAMARQGQTLASSLLPRPLNLKELMQRCIRTYELKPSHTHTKPLCTTLLAPSDHASQKASLIQADPDALENIFWNLVENAIKYGKPSFPIHLHIASTAQPPLTMHMAWCVANLTETLYSPEALLKIQMPFSRMDDQLTRSQEGLGLGLYIMHQLTEAMGAKLTLHSEPLSNYVKSISPIEQPDAWHTTPPDTPVFWVQLAFPCFSSKASA
ncbi:MAG: sensor histidine kinase [Vampirovibrionales bacterium]